MERDIDKVNNQCQLLSNCILLQCYPLLSPFPVLIMYFDLCMQTLDTNRYAQAVVDSV